MPSSIHTVPSLQCSSAPCLPARSASPLDRGLFATLAATLALALGACANNPSGYATPPSLASNALEIHTSCEKLATEFVAHELPRGVRITATQSIPAGTTVTGMAQPYPMPAHCRVTGVMGERTGVDGKPYALGFEMRLPTPWNGRFLFQANGGNDGVVVPAYGNVVSGGPTTNALLQGFAVLSSDMGHTMEPAAKAGLVGGNLFGMDPQARLDYGYQGTAALAPMAKQLIGTYYGQAPQRSYMMGCSNGGRQAMVAAARYASLFDGVVAGDPGYNLPKASVQHAWDIQAFHAVNPDIKAAFSPADMQLVARKVLERCDALDGLKDGMVNNLAACQKAFDISSLRCSGGSTDQCLSPAQVTALTKVFAGPVNSQGEHLYSDWPWDAGVGSSATGFGSWRAWKLQGPIANLPIIGVLGGGSVAYIFSTPPQPVAGNPPALIGSLLKYNFDTDAKRIFATQAPFNESAMSFMTPPDATELKDFAQRGDKIIVYHGTSDPVFSFNDTAAWWEALNRNHGGHAADFARLFPVPGMNHCQSGPATDQFDPLSALVNWVEKGQAPESLVASARVGSNSDVPADWQSNGVPRSRPLCVYPQQVRYNGSGDINTAASFHCE